MQTKGGGFYSAVSPSFVHALSAFVSTKVDYLSSSLSASLNRTVTHSSDAATEARRLELLESRYNLQLAYVQSLSRQLASAGKARALARHGVDAEEARLGDSVLGAAGDEEEADQDAPVRVTAPSRANLAAQVQGPFLLQPAPAELDNGADDRAVDLAYLSTEDLMAATPSANGSPPAGAGLGVLVVAYRDGKVDVCLEVEKPEARFVGERSVPKAASPAKGAVVLRRRGFGAAAFDDDDDDGEDEEKDGVTDEDELDLPTLAVYESIDLGLAAELNPNSDDESAVRTGLRHNAPRLVRDPLYADTIYVQHALGAHCLLLGPWLDDLAQAMSDSKAEDEVARILQQSQGTEVLWVLKTQASNAAERRSTPTVDGLVVLNDVYLGYSLLLVTSALQLVGIELSLRVDETAGGLERTKDDAASGDAAYVSLLEKPFSVPPMFSQRHPGAPPILPRLPSSKKALEINPETLRAFATHVSSTQTAIRDLVSAADSVQSRLELQMRELSRQVEKLAELDRMRDELGKSVSGGTEGRLRRAEEKQRELLARTDRVLQRLVESHQPSISTYERKWFDELRRLEEQVAGRRPAEGDDDDSDGAADETQAASLEMRAKRVEAMFEALRPGLEELKRQNGSRSVDGTPGRRPAVSLGQNQVKILEERLSEE